MTEKPKSNDSLTSDAQEEAFFAGEGSAAETEMLDIEEELLWENQEEVIIPPFWRPIIPLALAFGSALILYFFLDDFRFALSTHKPVDLGSVVSGCQDKFYKKLPHNRVVQLRGVLPQPNLTAEARVHFSKRYYVVALGCDLLVSLSEKRYQALLGPPNKSPSARPRVLPIPSNLREKLGLKAKVVVQTRDTLSDTNFVVQGRAVLASRSSAADNLRRFYAVTESMPFTPRTHIIFDGEEPKNMWWVLIVYTILSAFLVYNLWRFGKAVRAAGE